MIAGAGGHSLLDQLPKKKSDPSLIVIEITNENISMDLKRKKRKK